MQKVPDIIKVCEQLDTVISEDIEGINFLASYLEKRYLLEEQFYEGIHKFFDASPGFKSSSMHLMLDEMFALRKKHKAMADNIKNQFIPPISKFKSYAMREQKQFKEKVNSIKDSVKVLNKKLGIVQSQYDQAKIDSLHFSPNKAEKSRRTLKSLELNLLSIRKEQQEQNQKVYDEQYPKLMSVVNDLDYSIRTTIKSSVLNLVHYEMITTEQELDDLNTVHVSTERYDPTLETNKMSKALGYETKQRKIYAIALANYDGNDPHDLSFSRGQLIEVIRQHPSGWWDGDTFGRKGIFPMTYVEIIPDIINNALIINELFEVDHRFVAEEKGQISLDRGDVVFVRTLINGVCEGYNYGTRESGTFPQKIVKNIKSFRQTYYVSNQ